jgi:Mg-chelatase subunit ChlD
MTGNTSIRAVRRVIRPALAAAVVVAVVVVAALLGVAPASAAPAATEEEVYRALSIDEVAAEYVVLIDTSSSMQQGVDLYGAVKASLRGFLAALSPTDDVVLVTFDSEAAVRYHGKVGAVPDDLLGKLPPAAAGTSTDIGRALESAVTILRESAAPIATVVMFTDGQHDPPQGSPYPFPSGESWNRLSRSAAEIKKEALIGYSVPLRGESDAGLLKTIVPGATVLNVSSVGELTRDLEAPKQASRAAKARNKLGDDPHRGVTIEWPSKQLRNLSAGENRTHVTFRSATSRIPLEVGDLTVKSSDGRMRVRLETNRVTLKPGERKSVGLVVSWDAGTYDWAPFDLRRIRAEVTLAGNVDSPWSTVLKQNIQATFAPPLEGVTEPVDGAAQRGRLAVWVVVLVAAALAAAVLVVRRQRLDSPVMSGRLLASSPTTGRQYGTIELSGRRISIGPATTLNVPGQGTVRGTRTQNGTAIRISYSPKDAPERLESARCRLGQLVILNGIAFEWVDSDAS